MYPVIGMSPGNGYFKQEVVNQLLQKAIMDYGEVGIFIPDIPAISTYIALGYTERRARIDKAIPQGNALSNKVKHAIKINNIDPGQVRVLDWMNENIEHKQEYKSYYEYIGDLYKQNSEFKREIDSVTKEVLINNIFRKKEITQFDIEIAIHYLISEFAFILFLPKYLNKKQIGYIYHRPWPVFEKFISGEYDNRKKENISFIQYSTFN